MFRKSDINDIKYTYLKNMISDNFEILEDGHSKIIFGYNGTCKTSIYKYLKENGNINNYMFLDYHQELDGFNEKDKKLIVSPLINSIEEKNYSQKIILDELNFRKALKDNFEISTKTDAQLFGEKIVTAQTNNHISINLTEIELQNFNQMLGTIPLKIFIKNKSLIEIINNIEEELSNYKNILLKRAYKDVIEYLSEDESNICPICDQPKENVKEYIRNKNEELTIAENNVINSFAKDNIIIDIPQLSQLKSLCNEFCDDKLADYILCNGNLEILRHLKNQLIDYDRLEQEKQELEQERENGYRNLENVKETINQDLHDRFDISNDRIVFDPNNKKIEITMERKINEYSTGEINLLKFLFKIYEFIGSNKQYLILDDPISSLDIINHYKIAYEIVKASHSKTIIAFTHSIEMLNTLNSQHNNFFKFYYIEKINNIKELQEIPSNYPDNIITLDNLRRYDVNNILKALIKKENSPRTDNIHKLFHYNGTYIDPEFGISNENLAEKIDNYTPLQNISFLENSYNKVICLASLRVWVEKQLRKLLVKNGTEQNINDFDSKNSLFEKILYIFPYGRSPIINGIPNNLSRDKLMTKKVLLNQGIHYQSQVMPYYFALNISIDDLNKEIVSIKNMFTN